MVSDNNTLSNYAILKNNNPMCDCIKNLENKMIGRLHKNKKITGAIFISAAIMLSSFKTQASGELELTIEGMKKKQLQKVIYTYCPFCGEKYPETKN